jgi:hypothetical protein
MMQMNELQHEYGSHPKRCKLSLYPPHLGIEFPLRYNLKDYGIDIYLK